MDCKYSKTCSDRIALGDLNGCNHNTVCHFKQVLNDWYPMIHIERADLANKKERWIKFP